MAQNPFKDSKRRLDRRNGDYALGVAKVVSSPDDAAHRVAIVPLTSTGRGETSTQPSSATVLVDQKGDISVPSEGDLVLFGRLKNRDHIVIGTIYSKESTIRDYHSEERHIGHEDGAGTFIHGPFGVQPRVTEDPEDAPDGSIWYREDIGEYRGMEDETKVKFDTTEV